MWKNLTDREFLATLLAKHGVVLKKTAGQHFLVCPEVVEATSLVLDKKIDRITELGAGVGSLTQSLLEGGWQVKAIERDRKLADLNLSLVPGKNKQKLDLIVDDLREQKWEWRGDYQLVGNIPYNLSGLIIRRITQLEPSPDRAVLLVQREVGERLVTEAPQLSLIGLAVQLWGKAQLLMQVPKDCFWPPPRVDSQLILLTPHSDKVSLKKADREQILKLAKRFFQLKRKQVSGVASRVLDQKKSETDQLIKQVGIKAQARPQEITPQQWLALWQAWYTAKHV